MRSIATISRAASAILCLLGTGCEARRVTEAEAELTASVSVTPPVAAVTVQRTVALSAVAKNVAGALLQDRPITWSSANPSVATVSSDGNVTGIAIGVTTVVATSDGKSGTSTISVTAVPVSSVEVIPSAARIPVGDVLQLAAVAKDDSNTQLPDRGMAWSSSHASVARVTAAGLVTAVAVGTAYVIATSEGKSDTSAIEVTEAPVASVVVAPSTATVDEGATAQLSATIRDANGTELTGRVVTWASSNAAAATVSSSGMVTGIAPGSATVTATSEGRSGTAVITVVTRPALVVNAGADQTITLGTPASLNATVASNAAGPLRMFWSKIAGPGAARFAHEQFSTSFEDGTISDWTGDGNGAQEGGAYVTQERAYSGAYSWKAYNDPSLPYPYDHSAKLLRWRFDYAEAYYSAWYYWPTDYLVNDGTGRAINMFQFKERYTPWDPTWVFGAKRSPTGPGDDLNLYDWHGGVAYNVPGGMPLPKGRWFQVVAYQKIGRTDGELTIFVDGVRILNLAGINTLGSVTNNNPPFVMWGVGNYGPAGIGKHIYVDDTSVANAAVDSRSTSVQFSAPGTYLLRLTASNAQVTLSDTVQVIVR